MRRLDVHNPVMHGLAPGASAFEPFASPRVAAHRAFLEQAALFQPLDQGVDLALARAEIADRRIRIDLRELIGRRRWTRMSSARKVPSSSVRRELLRAKFRVHARCGERARLSRVKSEGKFGARCAPEDGLDEPACEIRDSAAGAVEKIRELLESDPLNANAYRSLAKALKSSESSGAIRAAIKEREPSSPAPPAHWLRTTSKPQRSYCASDCSSSPTPTTLCI